MYPRKGLLVVFMFLAIAGLVISLQSPGEAAQCSVDTLANYILLPSTGCTIGSTTFVNFSYQVLEATGGASAPLASSITVTPLLGALNPGFQFGGTWSIGPLQALTTNIFYDLSTSSGLVVDDYAGKILSKTTTGSGSNFFDNVFLTNTNVTLITDIDTNFLLASTALGGSNSKLEVGDQLILNTAGGTVSTTGFSQNFSLKAAVQAPEPGSLVLVATGLFLPLILSRRWRRASFGMLQR